MSTRRLRMLSVCLVSGLLAVPASVFAGLADYVNRPDPAFAWTLLSNHDTPEGKILHVKLTSQVWQDIPWVHQLRIYEPTRLTYPDAVLLFITGGSTDSQPKDEDHALAFGLAKACGARVAVLPQVPNQPLLGGKKEDDLIAETFMMYLQTKDENLPLLFPMVKSAVAAMNAVQALGKEHGKPVTRFVVTGASKRGWTTWLTGSVDPRVVAIAPMVIPTLNMRAQRDHQLEVWGKYSEQIEDYSRRGLLEKMDTPDGTKLWKMIDPYTYLDKITMPVLQINGTNDRYWTLDSMNLFWNDIKAPKWVVYLPNAGHGLNEHREYATHGISALFRHAVSGRPMPTISWTFSNDDPEKATLTVTCLDKDAPKSIQVWVAHTDSHDFRESPWTSRPVREIKDDGQGRKIAEESVERPDSGWSAVFADLTYEIDGMDYHLSTQIFEVGTKPAN